MILELNFYSIASSEPTKVVLFVLEFVEQELFESDFHSLKLEEERAPAQLEV